MAVEPLRVRSPRDLPLIGIRTLVAPTSIASPGVLQAAGKTEPRPWPRALVRLLEMAPGALALFLISALTWGYVWFPAELAVGLLLFDVYWFWKSWTIGFHALKGTRMMRRYQERDWRAEHAQAAAERSDVLPWEDVRHVVIIPNYSESEDKLRQTLSVMAAANGATESIIPVLAMEEAEAGAHAKAAVLSAEFAGRFSDLLVTFHPKGLPGELRGKSSNQAWAARCAVAELVGRRGLDLDVLTVTSCDADTQFPPRYFDCLTFKFATDPARYRRFWQAPIFFYNNIWQVPAPLRVPNALSGLIHLSRLSRRRRVLFSQSTYSLSMRMAHDVGYWDTDVIPEDWHMFLKCFYSLGGAVEVEPIHLAIGNDGALSRTPRATYVNQYLQVRRWAWGASDIPYVLHLAFRRTEIALSKRLLRSWYVFENHLSWSTQWFFITLGGNIPWVLSNIFGYDIMPHWFTLYSRIILTPCLLPYVVLIVLDARLRPPPPPSLSRLHRALLYLYWLAIPPITFLFSALPALDSQVRLLLGRRMEYRVTEKV
jgi:hypothetical protein